jgi:two-component system invasion response regulator UvrY
MDILIIDDHASIRSGVRFVLSDMYKDATLYEACDEKTALEHVKGRKHDLIIMDVQMPKTDTFGLLEYIKLRQPRARVLMFSMSNEMLYAKRFLRNGAMGFVPKDTGLPELMKAVETVMGGNRYISETLADLLAEEISDESPSRLFDKLSQREFEVATLLLSEKSTTEIAETLSINASTVATHKARIFEKLGIKSVAELAELEVQGALKEK